MSEQNNSEKGMRKLSTFITADALLAAVLLIWAQLWMHPSMELFAEFYRPEHSQGMEEWFKGYNVSLGVGLAWAYLAVFLALMALAWAGWKTLATSESKTPDTAIGLFAASVTMGAIEVLVLFFTVS